MEQGTETNNTGSSSKNRSLARKVLDAWKQTRLNERLSGSGEIDTRRFVRRMGSVASGGMSYPGPLSGVVSVPQDGEEHKGDHYESSFNDASKAG